MSNNETVLEITLSKFHPRQMRPNSVIAMLGQQTNTKGLFKVYGKYFESQDQFITIMESLTPGTYLVIDQTAPHNRMEDMVFLYTP